MQPLELVPGVLRGDQRSVSRLLTLVENGEAGVDTALKKIFPATGRAYTIGITGPPGAGKSTLVGKLVKRMRLNGLKVGVIAVDPTSPFSGGAILGDRIRMNSLATDPGVFIRSMGNRGHLGGLARSTGNVIKVLDAAGMDYILVETVGVGQAEVDVAYNTDLTIIVLVPGMGDGVQSIKAGILETGDLFVVNKADREGADRLVRELDFMLATGSFEEGSTPSIIKTVATGGEGIEEVFLKIEELLGKWKSSSKLDLRRKERLHRELLDLVREKLWFLIRENAFDEKGIASLVDRIARGELDPFTAANGVVEVFYRKQSQVSTGG